MKGPRITTLFILVALCSMPFLNSTVYYVTHEPVILNLDICSNQIIDHQITSFPIEAYQEVIPFLSLLGSSIIQKLISIYISPNLCWINLQQRVLKLPLENLPCKVSFAGPFWKFRKEVREGKNIYRVL